MSASVLISCLSAHIILTPVVSYNDVDMTTVHIICPSGPMAQLFVR